MPVYHFEAIKVAAQRRVTCPGCGKKRTVRRTFEETINPYHPVVKALATENPDGLTTRQAVTRSVEAKADAWTPSDNESRHGACSA